MALKAFRIDADGRLRFLFHAHQHSSLVPLDTWLEARAKWVQDGSGQKRKYRSGFHFFPTGAETGLFDKLTKCKYTILPVIVEDVHPKPRSSVGSWIARRLYVPSAALAKEKP